MPSKSTAAPRSLLYAITILLAATHTLAQANQPPGNNPAPAPAASTSSDTAATSANSATSTTATSTATSATTSVPPTTNTQSTNAPTSTSASSSTTSASSATSAPPTLSSSSSATFAASGTSSSSSGTAPPLPTLSNVLPPPLVVPDTSSAPFRQHSNLPEGTVFICVGAALGFLGLCVLAWRGLIAWSLHRSVRRAAETAYAPDSKSPFGWGAATSSNGAYKSMYTDSNLSMEALSNTKGGYATGGAGETHGRSKEEKRASHMSTSAKRASKQPSNASLFFSPTASAGQNVAGNRSSGYHPAGFYAPGSSAANAGNAMASLGGPQAAGYGRVQSRDGLTPTPPDSPSLRAASRPTSMHLRPDSAAGPGNRHSARLSRGEGTGGESGERANRRSRLSRGVSGEFTGRAPSMYLEELFENHGHGPGERF